MRICLLGEFSGNLDEGMRKVSSHFAEELTKQHQILALDLRDVLTKNFWKTLKNSNPEIIHYIHGPSIRSFILLKFISIYYRNAKTVMSAMRPYFTFLSKRFISFLKPDLILVQSYETEEIFEKLGCKTVFLPCGVDVERFKPATKRAKEELKKKYRVDNEKFILLHVGSIKKGRNIQLLEKLQKRNNQVVIIGALSPGINKITAHQLEKSGCLVWTRYLKNVEEIYTIANCYIFPTVSKNDKLEKAIADSIEMPLSVLEAMACNLPVITTKFGALPRVFEEGEGLLFVDKEEGFIDALDKIERSNIDAKTREKVLPYSWENVGKKLEKIYRELIGEGNEN